MARRLDIEAYGGARADTYDDVQRGAIAPMTRTQLIECSLEPAASVTVAGPSRFGFRDEDLVLLRHVDLYGTAFVLGTGHTRIVRPCTSHPKFEVIDRSPAIGFEPQLLTSRFADVA